MAKKRKTEFIHCKVSLTTHPKAPWRVSYPTEENGKTVRRRRMFASEERALAFAEETEREVDDHGVRFGGITADARRAFDYYRDARADLKAEGITPPAFDELVIEAVRELRRKHEEAKARRVSVDEAVDVFLEARESNVSLAHMAGMRSRLARFTADFGARPLHAITAEEVELWLASLRQLRPDENGHHAPCSPTTRNAFAKSLHTLFKFACGRARRWCSANPVAEVERCKVTMPEPEAYSPQEAAAILRKARAANSPLLPTLTLGLFCGLRPSEAQATDLSTIDLQKSEFRTPARKPNGEPTKTGARVAPLTPAARAFLASQPRRTGLAWEQSSRTYSKHLLAILEAAGVRFIHDGLRHSFISYRLAEIRDVARVADEVGNSPAVIKKHYRKIVTAEAAKKYFAIRPEAPAANVVPMQGRASA
jgi:integrase